MAKWHFCRKLKYEERFLEIWNWDFFYFHVLLEDFECHVLTQPFVCVMLQVGIQNKISDLKMKTSNLVHVDVFKDQVCWGFSSSLSYHFLNNSIYREVNGPKEQNSGDFAWLPWNIHKGLESSPYSWSLNAVLEIFMYNFEWFTWTLEYLVFDFFFFSFSC